MKHYLTLAIDSRNNLFSASYSPFFDSTADFRAVQIGLLCLLYVLIQWQATTTYGPDLKPSEVDWNVSNDFIRLWIGSEVQQFTQL